MSLESITREFLEAITMELDPYTSTKGIIQNEGSGKMVLLTPAHIQFAKYGRGPGKQPPHQAMLDWVKEENIKFDGSDHEGTAWAIGASIGKNGTLNWVRNAPNAMDEAITKNFFLYNQKVGSVMAIEIENKLLEEYEKMFPPVQKFNF